jgi:hypothetical protein
MAIKKKTAAVDPKMKRWKEEGRTLRVSQRQWIIADWILRGMELFKSKTRAYDEASALTGMTRETLQQFKMTAEFFPPLTRVKDLSFGHHRLVANKKYTESQRSRYLQHAKEAHESVDRFAAYLRNRDHDASRRSDNRTAADQAADKVIEGCNELLRNYNFVTLLNDPPSRDVRAGLLERLKKTVAELNSKAEQMAAAWRDADEADEAFEQGTAPETKALGVAAR